MTTKKRRFFGAFVWLAAASGCSRTPGQPGPPASQRPIAAEPEVSASAATPPVASREVPAEPDVAVPFERFLGGRCALARTGEVWCNESQGASFHRVTLPEASVTAVSTYPMRYVLSRGGQVYLVGKLVPEAPGAATVDHSVPQRVDGLSDVVELASEQGQVFALRASGAVETWRLDERRDDNALSAGIDVGKRVPVNAGARVKRLFINLGGYCFVDEKGLGCTDDLRSPARPVALPSDIDPNNIDDVEISDSTCILERTGKASCFPVKPDKLARSGFALAAVEGRYSPALSLRKIVAEAGGFVGIDRDDKLWFWRDYGRAPEYRELTGFGKVRDYSRYPRCAITRSGRLLCHDPGRGVGAGDLWEGMVPADAPLSNEP